MIYLVFNNSKLPGGKPAINDKWVSANVKEEQQLCDADVLFRCLPNKDFNWLDVPTFIVDHPADPFPSRFSLQWREQVVAQLTQPSAFIAMQIDGLNRQHPGLRQTLIQAFCNFNHHRLKKCI